MAEHRMEEGSKLLHEAIPVDGTDLIENDVALLAQDIFCFNDWNYFCGGINGYGAQCSGGSCTIDWDAQRTLQPPLQFPNSFDVSYGRMSQPANPTPDDCYKDVLVDVNDLAVIQYAGKNALWAGADAQVFSGYGIYQDTFNAGTPANLDGWDFQITSSGVTWPSPFYPVNVALSAAECPSGGCRWDICNSASDCRDPASQTCTNSRCSCSSDADCFSGWCHAGECVDDYCACSCTTQSECFQTSPGAASCDLTKSVCKSVRTADMQPREDYRPTRKAAGFPGLGTSRAFIRLVNSGSTSPVTSIDTNNAFTVHLDFRFDGFAAGQTQQSLVYSNAFSLSLRSVAGNTKLYAQVGTQPALVLTPRYGNIQWGRWYRLTWAVDWPGAGHPQYVQLRAWDSLHGWYDESNQLVYSGCEMTSLSGGPGPVGDVYIGTGATATYNFFGAIDNFTIVNWGWAIPDSSVWGC